MRVFKYHGTGNDFVLVENMSQSIEEEQKPALAKRLCHRRLGVGGDGMLLVEPSEQADVRFRYFNSDGSEAGMCGNGMRCFAKHVYDFSIVGSRCMRVETPAGEVGVCVVRSRGARAEVRVEMGVPKFEPSRVPVRASSEVLGMRIETPAGEVEISAVNTGVPHAVVFVEDVERVDVETLGRAVRWHPVFPEGANVNFVQVVDGTLKVRTYERGVEAETPACGTGITASCAVALRLGMLTGREFRVLARGGELLVSVDGDSFYLTGPAVRVFKAEVDALEEP